MAAHLIEPTDSIEVNFVPLVLFGPPGCGKTSLAQTAEKPLTLDFDEGIHRSKFRRHAMRFDTWEDVIQAGDEGRFEAFDTLIADTGGSCLQKMMPGILSASSKNGGPGGLSPQGWGVLGRQFAVWLSVLRSWNKQLVFVCHEDATKDQNGDLDVIPALPGKMAWTAISQNFDLIGCIRYDGDRRILDFSPRQGRRCLKNAAGFAPQEIGRVRADGSPRFIEDNPHFLAELIAKARLSIGKTAEASAAVAQIVEDFRGVLGKDPSLDELNGVCLPKLLALEGAAKTQCWHLLKEHAVSAGLTYDAKAKVLRRKEAAA